MAYGEQQHAAGKSAWLTPPILYWHDWLAGLLASAHDPAGLSRRLDDVGAGVLWERCLRRRMPDTLLNFPGVVRYAVQAWQRLRDWNLSMTDLLASARSQDEQLFAHAAADYRDRLDAGHWVDNPGLASIVADLIRERGCELPNKVVLAGFDRISPAVEAVVGALESVDCRVTVREMPSRHADVSIATFARQDAELRAAGNWARQRLQKNPGARLAIVCPGLEAGAAELGRLVREGVAPGWQYGDSSHRLAVNVSYGKRLAEYPAIAIALLLLRWVRRGLTGKELSTLLRSRCLAGSELADRCRLEIELRQLPDREWYADHFLAVFGDAHRSDDNRAFLNLVRRVSALQASADKRTSPFACVAQIDELLAAVRWPGAGALDSAEFQLVNRWRELLNEFARIEPVRPQLTLSEAIRHLTSIAADTLWQPESESGVVHLLGVLEAAGLEFDGLWVSGMDASQWPPPSRPSPFISHALQREHGMPDATPADTLAFANRILRRLLGAADECILSWSQTSDDGDLAASTLLDDIGMREYNGPGDPGWYVQHLATGSATVIETDDDVAPVGPQEKVAGGAYTLQRQYEEPLAAFVFGRLGVEIIESFRTGLSPSLRGTIIHNALHNLLMERPALEQLQGWSQEERDRRIGSAVDTALAVHDRNANAVVHRLIVLERQRLIVLLRDFLAAECDRPPFTIADVERRLSYAQSGLRLEFRVDRIDCLADERLLVIDYKTGTPKSFLRQSGDLKDLQLAAYADALDTEIGGLVYINVDSRAVRYKGAGGGWNPAEEEDWAQRLDGWRAVVQNTARALAAGDVRINIRQSPSDGRALSILSRLEEQKRVR